MYCKAQEIAGGGEKMCPQQSENEVVHEKRRIDRWFSISFLFSTYAGQQCGFPELKIMKMLDHSKLMSL